MKTTEYENSSLQCSALDSQRPATRRRLAVGAFVAHRELATISRQVVPLPDPQRYIHLQFRRFAGCPVCDLHLRSFVQRHSEVEEAGIREIVLFHSTVEELTVHASGLPFAVVADPHKRLYAEFGVEASKRSLLDPRASLPIIRAVSLRLWELVLARKRAPSLHIHGGRFGLPADFLIASDGSVIACKYGVHVYDQWSVDELLGLVAPKNALSSPHRKE